MEQGGLEINGEKAADPTVRYDSAAFTGEGLILKKGKKVFHRVVTE